MMYYYWKKKGIRPSVWYTMSKGEELVLRAFFETEIEEENKKREQMAKGGFICPAML